MPVFHSKKDGVLVITVDGDYTSGELKRVGGAAVADPDTPTPALILLDVSGAAGLGNRTAAELMETAEFFGSMGVALSAVAILAPSDDAHSLMRMGMTLYADRGIQAEVFRDRTGAMAWLATC